MKLIRKGESVTPGTFDRLTVRLKWTTAVDFDLAAFYKDRSGQEGLLYFGELGSLESYPFMELSNDQGSEDNEGNYEEFIRISSLDVLEYVWVMCWDYKMIEDNRSARFDRSDIEMTIAGDKDNVYQFKLESDIEGNTAIIATIDNTKEHPLLSNAGYIGTLSGLSSLEQISKFIHAFSGHDGTLT